LNGPAILLAGLARLSLRAEGAVRSRTHLSAPAPERWRGVSKRHLTALLAIKLAALVLLWALFFSPAHRVAVEAEAVGRQLALGQKADRP
jgi:type II secretory pathway component PulM